MIASRVHAVRFRRVAALAGCAMALACAGPAREDAPPSADTGAERVVARVNGVPLPASRLEALVDAERMRRGAAPRTEQEERELRRDALELLIRSELLYQAAVERGVDVPEEAIEEQLRVARSQFASEEEFQAYLGESGTTKQDLRGEARRRLTIEAYAATVTQDVVADPEQARELYRERVDRIPAEEQVRAAQILVRLRPDDPPERRRAARKRIDEAHRRAAAGEDFAQLAREYSESPLAERGGDMGFIPRGRMLPEFEDVVFATPVGEITPVFETPHGFNVVQVLERRSSRPPGYGEVETGLLLVLARERRDEALRRHLDDLERRADIQRTP